MAEVLDKPGIVLSEAELEEITNGLTQPAAQLRQLHRQGFVKACRPRGGRVVLYRTHYEAVTADRGPPDRQAQNAATGPNVVGLEQWSKGRKRGTQTQGR